jgi:predicted DNA-binding transcriptional regulator AlpA
MIHDQQDSDMQNSDQPASGDQPKSSDQQQNSSEQPQSSEHERSEGGEAPAVNEARELEKKLGFDKSLVLRTLATGKSVAETSRLMGLSRMTIYRWLKKDADFRAAFNEWQNSVQLSVRARLLAMTDAAVDAVGNAVAKGDAKLSIALLTKLKTFEAAPTDKPTSSEEARQEIDLEERRRRADTEIARTNLESDKLTAEFARDMWAGEPKRTTVKAPTASGGTIKKTVTKVPPDPEAR